MPHFVKRHSVLVERCWTGFVVPLLAAAPFQQLMSSWGHLSSHILEASALQQLLLEQEVVSGNMWLWCKKSSGEAAVAGSIWLIILMSKKLGCPLPKIPFVVFFYSSIAQLSCAIAYGN